MSRILEIDSVMCMDCPKIMLDMTVMRISSTSMFPHLPPLLMCIFSKRAG